MRGRWWGRTMAAAVVATVLAGCAAIPTTGPVRSVDDTSGDSGSTVRYRPAGPAAGASPEEIVRGFLDAMLAYPTVSDVAAAYLTPSAGNSWRPSSGFAIYRGRPDLRSISGSGDTRVAVLVTQRTGTLDGQGRYTASSREVVTSWPLKRSKGQWRLATAPAGLWVSSAWFDDYIRPFDLYFLDASRKRVVPSPVWEVVGDQLATSLAASLAEGPSRRFDSALGTAMPAPAQLRKSVPVDSGGLAQVAFTMPADDLGLARQEQILAQLAWTMKSAPGVNELQVTADGVALAPRGSAGRDLDGWDDFGWPTGSQLAVVAGGRVRLLGDSRNSALPGAWGRSAKGVTAFGLGQDMVAAVVGSRVRVTHRDGSHGRWVSGRDWLAPQVDSDAVVWLVDRPGTVRVRVVTGDTLRQIDARRLGRGRVTALRISPDGARYAAIINGRLAFGAVVRAADGRATALGAPTVVPTTARRIGSPDWFDGTYLTYLGDGATGRQVYTSRIDGSGTSSPVPGSSAGLAGVAPRDLRVLDDQVYVLDDKGRVWTLDGVIWRKLDVATVTAIG